MSNETHVKIMDAAKSLFSENGYAAVTTKKIAERAGVSEVTLYRHFESKRSLFNYIIKENMSNFEITDYLEKSVTYDVRKDLTKVSNLLLETYLKNREFHRMVIKDKFLNSEARTHYKKAENKELNALREYFKNLKEKELVSDDPGKLMRLFITNIHGYVMHNFVLRSESQPEDKENIEYFDWLIDKIIDMILM